MTEIFVWLTIITLVITKVSGKAENPFVVCGLQFITFTLWIEKWFNDKTPT